MYDRKIFGLAVRLVGLFYAVWSFEWLVSIPWMIVGSYSPTQANAGYGVGSYLFAGGWRLAVGVLLIRFADSIVRFSFSECYGEGRCKTCGYDMRATPDRCPECGKIPETAI